MRARKVAGKIASTGFGLLCISIHKLRGQYRIIGGTYGEPGEIIDFDPPMSMPPLPRNSARSKKLRQNQRWLKRRQERVPE